MTRRWSPAARGRVLLVVGIGLAVALLLVAVIAGALSAARSVGDALSGPPVIAGEPGEPRAAEPVACPDACLGLDALGALVPGDSIRTRLGVATTREPADLSTPYSAQDVRDAAEESWNRVPSTPDTCRPLIAAAPAGTDADTPDSVDDPVLPLGAYSDSAESSILNPAVRVFRDSASATAHLEEVAAVVEGCTGFVAQVDGREVRSTVDPAARFEVPDSVAAIGWIRTGVRGFAWRAYVADLQYANLVLRVQLLTDGSIPEEDFRDFVTGYAAVLSTLAPPVSADAPDGTAVTAIADDPVECDDRCLDRIFFGLTSPSPAELDALGLTVAAPQEWREVAEAIGAARQAADVAGTPLACVGITTPEPVLPGSSAETGEGVLGLMPARATPDRSVQLELVDREFDSSRAAQTHLGALLAAVRSCDGVPVDLGDGAAPATVRVDTALAVPAQVAAVPWRVDVAGQSLFGVDLQRGNVVTRVTMQTDDPAERERFRVLVVSIAERLAAVRVVDLG